MGKIYDLCEDTRKSLMICNKRHFRDSEFWFLSSLATLFQNNVKQEMMCPLVVSQYGVVKEECINHGKSHGKGRQAMQKALTWGEHRGHEHGWPKARALRFCAGRDGRPVTPLPKCCGTLLLFLPLTCTLFSGMPSYQANELWVHLSVGLLPSCFAAIWSGVREPSIICTAAEEYYAKTLHAQLCSII